MTLRSLLAKIDRNQLPPADWLRAGAPRLPLCLLALLLPLTLAGPIRFLSGWSLRVGLLLGVAVTALTVFPFARALGRRAESRAQSLAANAIVIVVGLFAAWLLFNSRFGGLVNLRGPNGLAVDAGFHVHYYRQFIADRPHVYAGFVSTYSLWYTLGALAGGDPLFGACATFLIGLFIAAAVPCVICFSVLYAQRARRWPFAAGALSCLVCSLASQYFLVLPLEWFQHVGGFWAQLFGVVPLVALWLADALVRPRILRLGALLLLTVLYRYTYALNLTELLATVATVIALEGIGRDLPRLTRAAFIVGAIGCAAVSIYCFTESRSAFAARGWTLAHDLKRAQHGELWAILALAWSAAAWPSRALAGGTGIVRAVRFPLLFACWNVIVMLLVDRIPNKSDYYQNKLSFHALVILAGAFAVVIPFWISLCVRQLNRRTVTSLAVCCLLVALSQRELRAAFRVYQSAGFQEQLWGKPPYEHLNPWADRAVLGRIDRTLAATHKAFGGYLVSYWPMIVFMNSLYGFGDGDFWVNPTLDKSPGRCVFWEGGRYPDMDRDVLKQCHAYTQRWMAPGTMRTICSRCY